MQPTPTNPNPWSGARVSRLANCIDLAFGHRGGDLAREAWAQSQRDGRPFDADAFELAFQNLASVRA